MAAPVFKRIAEQVLSYLDVPRDVPLSPALLQTAYHQGREDVAASADEETPEDFPAQIEAPAGGDKQVGQVKEGPQTSNVTVAVDEGGDIAVPDFTGKTMREVTDICFRLGLNPVLVGSSLAVQQVPAPGSNVRRGTKVTVEFGMAPVKARKSH